MRIDRHNFLRLAIVFSLISLAAVFIAQYHFGLEPCILCVYQRIPYAIIAGVGLMSLALRKNSKAIQWIAVFCVFLFFAESALAFYHVGVEQHWWKNSGCEAPVATTIEELRAQLYAKKVTRCDEVTWSFAGLSMAGWNVILSFLMALIGVYSLLKESRHGRKKENEF